MKLPLGTPVELRKHDFPGDTKPMLSIACVTFNHAAFIGKCLEGFLRQKTTFPVEIIIHDDASTDGTADILRQYEAQYPRLIQTVIQTENQLSKIGGRIVLNATDKARGELIAYCEGDDVWTDEFKLQVQAEYLRDNVDCAGCFHRTRRIGAEDQLLQEDYFIASQDKYDFKDCLTSLGSAYASCSLVFRNKILNNPPDWFTRRLSDMFLELRIAQFGKIGYIDRNMADYRRHSGGNWSRLNVHSQVLELVHRYQLLLEEPSFVAAYGAELQTQLEAYSNMLCLRADSLEAKERAAEMEQRLHAAEKTLNQMKASLSWKTTSFLRYGLTFLKKSLGTFRSGRTLK